MGIGWPGLLYGAGAADQMVSGVAHSWGMAGVGRQAVAPSASRDVFGGSLALGRAHRTPLAVVHRRAISQRSSLGTDVQCAPHDRDDRGSPRALVRSEEHTSELQSLRHLVC